MNNNLINVIAEVANVHEGEFEYMHTLVTELAKTDIHAVKFQYVIPSEFGDPESENYIELNRLKFTHEEFQKLLDIFPDGQTVLFDVFAEESYKRVLDLKSKNQRLKINGVKLHVTNSMDFDLLRKAASDFDTIFISISGLTAIEINELISMAKNEGFFNALVLVYGVQNYPTKPESIKINKLSELKKIFGVAVALSDHLDGDNCISSDMIVYAQLLGYDYIEKHVTQDRSRRLDDDHAALNVNELILGMEKLKMVASTFTNNVLDLSADELDYRNKSKQAIYSNASILAKNRMGKDQIAMKRQEGNDQNPNYLNLHDILENPLVRDVDAGKRMEYKDFDRKVTGYILCRSSSSRFPNKCYQEVEPGVESLRLLIQRLKKSKTVNHWVICTTEDHEDNQVEEIGIDEGLTVVRGSENVYQRFKTAFEATERTDAFLRITADNVFIDPNQIDQILPDFLDQNFDYYRHSKVIDGCDFEIIKTQAYNTLEVYFTNYKEEAEYMTLYLENGYFRIMPAQEYDFGIQYLDYRFTLDFKEDMENICTLVKEIGSVQFTYKELCQALQNNSAYKPFAPVNKKFDIQARKKTLF
ncbi:N-acetylneuraminate synthase family protein [Bacteroidia bacterium]|nr:N-acetylneuraminate synthase family protein [Bacteroidia bacterium]